MNLHSVYDYVSVGITVVKHPVQFVQKLFVVAEVSRSVSLFL